MLVGREAECRELDRLLRSAADGNSGSLVIRGEAGMGKTALLEYAAEQAQGFLVTSARGVESESDFAFAGLVGICRPLLRYLERLPDPQQDALQAAIAVSSGTLVDRFTAFAAFLGLIGAAAEERPVLAVVDDLQWLDRSSTEAVLFAARRLGADRVAILMSGRRGEDEGIDLQGIPQIRLAGLRRDAGVRLLHSRGDRPLAEGVPARLVELTGGLPLALLEIPSLLTIEQLLGDEPLPDPLPVGDALRQAFRRELSGLPAACLEALLLVSADDTGSTDALGDALMVRGMTMAALDPAERLGVIRAGANRVEFRHPLLRSVVYHGAGLSDRRRAHRDLATAFARRDRARHIWHRAAAEPHPNEAIAAELEESAHDARSRGAHGTAALVLERAAELTPDEKSQARRRLEAGAAAWLSGQPHRAMISLDQGLRLTDDALLRADIQGVRGRLLYMTGSMQEAYSLLVDEARRVAPIAPDKAVAMLTLACSVCSGAALVDRGMEAASLATSIARRAGYPTELLAALALAQPLILSGRTREGQRVLRKWMPAARSYFRPPLIHPIDPVTGFIYHYVDYSLSRLLLDTFHEAARVREPQMLPQVLGSLGLLEFRLGEWALALAHATEGAELGSLLGQRATRSFALATLAAVEAGMGRDDARLHAREAVELAAATGARSNDSIAHHAIGMLDLGLGRVDDAVAALEEVGRLHRSWGVANVEIVPWMPDLVEAYVHGGREGDARRLAIDLSTRAAENGDQWSRAIDARCAGLVNDDFDEHFAAALELHDSIPTPFDRARTELAYGERLRRAGRRREARPHLAAAYEAFDRIGAAPWKARAEAEIGGTVPRVRTKSDAVERLSPQELQVALVVGAGATNREAAASLFVTAKTIEYHLGHIYQKLGIRSRSQLARLVATHPIAQLSSATD